MSAKSLIAFPGGSYIFADARFDHDLAASFFFAFSRAEYALKATGLVKSGSFDEAKPDWNAFLARVEHPFAMRCANGDLREAVVYLEAHPPSRQVWENGELLWRERTPRQGDTRSKIVIDHVKTIRNNLLHGGKEIRTRPLAERDSELLKAGLTVLTHVLSLDAEVANAFSDPGPDRPVA